MSQRRFRFFQIIIHFQDILYNENLYIQTQTNYDFHYNCSSFCQIFIIQFYQQTQTKSMNKIADRRRLHSLATLNQQDDPQLNRIITAGSVFNQQAPSLDQMRKIMKQLQVALKNERQLRIEAQENLKLHQTRTIFRQRQFYKILQQSDQKVRSYVTSHENSNIVKEIKKSYQSILRNFQRTNEATNSMIQSKYKQTLSAMERRLQTITSTMNEQIARTKMMSSKNINQIRKQIEQAISLLKNVENQNLQLKISIKKQKHKSRLLEEERKLLLQQIVNKKFAINKLFEQNKKYKKKCQENLIKRKLSNQRLSKTMNKYDNLEQSSVKKNLKLQSSTYNLVQTKQTTPQKQRQMRFFGQNCSFTDKTNKQYYYNTTVAKSRLSECTQKSNNIKQQNFRKQSCNFSDKKKGSNVAQINYKKMERKYTKRGVLSKNKILCDEDYHLLTLAKNNTMNTQSCNDNSIQGKNHNSQKAIQHLRICLQRQKKKVNTLGKLVTKFQNRNEQVNQVIIETLNEARSRGFESRQNLQNLLKCQKLLKLISDMKKRLSVCQNPTLHCGWGQIQIQQFLQQNDDKPQKCLKNEQPTIFYP